MNMMDASLKYLSDKLHSEKMVRSYLEKTFGNTQETELSISQVLQQLKEERLIDDTRLAEKLASHYAHKGNRFIANLLREKGISEQIILDALSNLDSEVNRALEEIKKRLSDQQVNFEKMTSFIYRFLHGRRFSYLTTRIVVNELSVSNARAMI